MTAKSNNGSVTLCESGIVITGKRNGAEHSVELPFKKIKKVEFIPAENEEKGVFLVHQRWRGVVQVKFDKSVNDDFSALNTAVNSSIVSHLSKPMIALYATVSVVVFVVALSISWPIFNPSPDESPTSRTFPSHGYIGVPSYTTRDGEFFVQETTPLPPAPVSEIEPIETETVSQRNATRAAQNYIDFIAFSRSGLIIQLEFEGFSQADASFAVANINVDWYEQAARMAQQYLDVMPFSAQGLVDQLEFSGFSPSQAIFGVSSAGFDVVAPSADLPVQNGQNEDVSLVESTDGEYSIVGAWNFNGVPFYVFGSNGGGFRGSGEFASNLRWTSLHGILSICITPDSCGNTCGSPNEYFYAVSANQLILTCRTTDRTVTYTR